MFFESATICVRNSLTTQTTAASPTWAQGCTRSSDHLPYPFLCKCCPTDPRCEGQATCKPLSWEVTFSHVQGSAGRVCVPRLGVVPGSAVKIRSVRHNNHRHAFEVTTWRGRFTLPYSKADPIPTAVDPIVDVLVDGELGREGFTYRLASGLEGSVHVEQVLEYNQDPGYMRDLLLYRLTLEAKRQVDESPLAKREIIRRLGTSPAQFYRLLDPTNYRKSVDKVLALLHVLDCEVDLVVRRSDRNNSLPEAVHTS